MITKITGEQPFQVLTNNFSISPSQEGYTLQISADGSNYSDLFAVSAGQTRMVSNVAANSFYRLKGNNSEVTVNWLKTCVTEGGGGDLSNYYTKDETDAEIAQAVSGISLDGYYTSAQTQTAIGSAITPLEAQIQEISGATPQIDLSDYYTSAQTEDAISAATAGKADAQSVTADYGIPIWNEQGVITSKKSIARTANSNVNGKQYTLISTGSQGFSIFAPTAVGTAGDILVSTGNRAPVWSAVTMPDMSEYWTSAETEEQILGKNYVTSAQTDAAISAATSGKADAVSITGNPARTIFPKWNSQGIITGEYAVANMGDLKINGTNKQVFFFGIGTRIATFYAPVSAGTAGEILVSTGSGAPVWSAVTIPDASDLDDLAAELSEAERVTAVSINDIRDKMVTSMDVKTIVKMSQASYDALTTKDQNTLYIITGTTN